MGYIGYIGRGFGIIHKNWQLVIVQIVTMVILIIPVIVVFIVIGVNTAELDRLQEIIFTTDAIELIAKYVSAIITVLISLIIYITLGFLLWVYVMGGSAGIIGITIKKPQSGFSLELFFKEANRLFIPITGYTTVIGLILIGGGMLVGLMGAAAVALLGQIATESMIGTFFKVLTVLVFGTGSIIFIFALSVVFAIGIGAMVIDGRGSMDSLDIGFKHLWKHPNAFWLMSILIIGYVCVQFPMVLISALAEALGGALLSLPFQIGINIFQSYLSLVMMAVVLVYYYSTSEGSTHAFDTYVGEVPAQVTLPPGIDLTL